MVLQAAVPVCGGKGSKPWVNSQDPFRLRGEYCRGNIVEYRSIIDPWKEVTEVYDCVDICVGRTCSFYLEVH